MKPFRPTKSEFRIILMIKNCVEHGAEDWIKQAGWSPQLLINFFVKETRKMGRDFLTTHGEGYECPINGVFVKDFCKVEDLIDTLRYHAQWVPGVKDVAFSLEEVIGQHNISTDYKADPDVSGMYGHTDYFWAR